MESKLFLILAGGLIFIFFMVLKPMEAFYAYIIVRPIIDRIDILRTKKIIGSINVLQAIGIVWPIALIVVCFFQGAKFFKHRITNIYLCFLFLCFPSIFISASWIEAFGDWLRLFTMWPIMIFVLHNVKTEDDIEKLFKVIFISSFFPLIQFANSFITGETLLKGGLTRYTGGYFHMGPISFILLLLIPSYLFFMEKSKNLLIKMLLGLGILYIIICIYFTYYRSSLIGVFVFFFTYFILKRKFIYSIGLLFGACLALTMSQFIVERFAPLIEAIKHLPLLLDPLNNTYDKLLSGRFGIWRRILTSYLYHCKPYNLFFGFGYRVTIGRYVICPHDDYMNFFFQNGFLAMVSFIAFLCSALSAGIATISKSSITTILFSILIASIIVALSTNYFVSVRVTLYMGIYIAMLIIIQELDKIKEGS